MPIRFRCAYCNQLMGISRRKAGTVVRCPSCSGQVVVPNPASEPTEKPQAPAQPELFERSNFDELFDDEMPPQPNSPVKLTHRVVMNFYTAKRLLHGLNFAVSRFEAAFGELELDVQKRVRVLQGPGGTGGMRTS